MPDANILSDRVVAAAAVAFGVIAICVGAAAAGGWAYVRDSEPRSM